MSIRQHRGSAWLAAAMLLGILTPANAKAEDSTLIEFKIEDQFKRKHFDTEFRGRPLIVIESDRKSNEFSEAWATALRDSLPTVATREDPFVVELAHVRGVPFFVKGKVRGKFPKDKEKWVLLDWKGTFDKAYRFVRDSINILVFDREGRLTYRVAGTEPEADKLSEILKSARGKRKRPVELQATEQGTTDESAADSAISPEVSD